MLQASSKADVEKERTKARLAFVRSVADRPAGNAAAVRALSSTHTLLWDARDEHGGALVFEVPPIHHIDGILLDYYHRRIEAGFVEGATTTMAQVKVLRDECHAALDLIHRLVRPAGSWLWRFAWVRRRWYASGNPFANATLGDLRGLLDFFCKCRTNSRLRVLSVRHRPVSRQRPITPTIGCISSGRFRSGWETMVTR